MRSIAIQGKLTAIPVKRMVNTSTLTMAVHNDTDMTVVSVSDFKALNFI